MTSFDLQTEKLLALSVKQYKELVQHTENMLQILETPNYSQISVHADNLKKLQGAACRNDELLLPLLEENPKNWEAHQLFKTRSQCINVILDLNQLLLPKIHGMLAVTSEELNKMRGGRAAFAGYSSLTENQSGLRGIV